MKVQGVLTDAVKTVDNLKVAVLAHRLKVPANLEGFKGFLVLHSTKGAALVGFERGYGLAFQVLEMLPNGVPRLSAPLIVKLSKVAVGLALGYNEVFSLVLMRSMDQLEALAQHSETIMGKEFDFSGLPRPSDTKVETTAHKTSMTAVVAEGVNVSPDVLSVSDSLMVCDMSLYGGSLSVDKTLMHDAYGGSYGTPSAVLSGSVELPEGLKAAVATITQGLVEMTTAGVAGSHSHPLVEKAKAVAADLISLK